MCDVLSFSLKLLCIDLISKAPGELTDNLARVCRPSFIRSHISNDLSETSKRFLKQFS